MHIIAHQIHHRSALGLLIIIRKAVEEIRGMSLLISAQLRHLREVVTRPRTIAHYNAVHKGIILRVDRTPGIDDHFWETDAAGEISGVAEVEDVGLRVIGRELVDEDAVEAEVVGVPEGNVGLELGLEGSTVVLVDVTV